jgi:Holliday junction resolvase RusA-like endonuclease
VTSFTIWIPGKATPQGSKKGFVINGRAILVDASEGNKAWRAHVTQRVREHMDYIRYKGAVNVKMSFYMEKAKSNKTAFMMQKPDIDKLCRSVMDALTDSEIIEDDSRVVSLTAKKYWADEQNPGVYIHIWQEKPNA